MSTSPTIDQTAPSDNPNNAPTAPPVAQPAPIAPQAALPAAPVAAALPAGPPIASLPAEALRRRCEPERWTFSTTEELADLHEVPGQERAIGAIRFGIGIRRDGYNLFVLGPTGSGKHTMVRQFLEEKAAAEPSPSDWVYVNNFDDPHRPRALRLPPGRGRPFAHDMEHLGAELKVVIPAAFESDAFRARKEEIEKSFKERWRLVFADLERRAEEKGLALVPTPTGPGLAAVRDGNVLDVDDFRRLPEDEQHKITAAMESLGQSLREALAQIPRWEREQREKIRELARQMTNDAIGHLIDEVRERNRDLPDVLAYLDAAQRDIRDNTSQFLPQSNDQGEAASALKHMLSDMPARRYRAALVVDNGGLKGAPVIYEDNPTHPNLVGRVEYRSELGALITDFTMLKPGSLHRANGGYLMLEARKLLQQPFSWEELKRCLRSREIRIESPASSLGLLSTATLDPEAIPFDAKVILVGERLLYYLLAHYDPEFVELFKVAADFEESIDRDHGADGDQLYARVIATLARREKLHPLDRGAIALVIEHAARMAGDAEKLSMHLRSVADLLCEADWAAQSEGRQVVLRKHVQAAIDAQIRRSDRVRERIYEEIRRGTLVVDTDGERVGQVNGLSVLQLGQFAFGRPSRITARVRLGRGEVMDIEREVALGGPLHSKGVLILSGFLGARYAEERPLSLGASLVFEQSYGQVDGDSASSAELYALLSAIAGVPIRQYLAVTGSVNQYGEVQAIGGVNEKIEGFFDVCRAVGLTGRQGVLIPATNVKHLMLREDVVEAVRAGRFHVWPVRTVDEGIALLTGMTAGERGADGHFPPGTFNRLVEDRLTALSDKARSFAMGPKDAAAPRDGHGRGAPPEIPPQPTPRDETEE